MKIALIQCPVWGTYDPPLALAQLSACLREKGHSVFVFDLNISLYHRRKEKYKDMWAWEQSEFWYDPVLVSEFFNDNKEIVEQYLKFILKTDASAFAFSVSASSRISSLKFAKLIKAAKRDAIVILGGPLFSESKWAHETLREDCVDIVIKGEGGITITELAKILNEKRDMGSCRGILFKKDGEIIDTGARPLIDNLDILPIMDFTGLPFGKYDDAHHIAIMGSRGCIFRCVFCSSREFWPGYSVMSAKRIFREIECHFRRNEGLGHFNFMDLVVNGDMKMLNELCDLLISDHYEEKRKWTANVIVRSGMTLDFLRKMRRAGCSHLIYGIESGSQRILDRMKKLYKIEVADKVIRATHEAGIVTTANFMFGFPGETEEDFQKTLDFVKRNHKYLDRVYPSRTFCALEGYSYLNDHREEFGIKPFSPNHLYWESVDETNNYPERLRRAEEFCKLAISLDIEVSCGLQTSVELDRWFNLGHYYEYKMDYEKAIDSFLRYHKLNPSNDVILKKIRFYCNKVIQTKEIQVSSNLSSRLMENNLSLVCPTASDNGERT